MNEDKLVNALRELISLWEKFYLEQNKLLAKLHEEITIEEKEVPQAIKILRDEIANSKIPIETQMAMTYMLERFFQRKDTYVA